MKKLTALLILSTLSFSLMACSEKTETSSVEIDPTVFLVEVEESLPEDKIVPMMELDATMVQEIYGIDDTMIESFAAKIPMMNVQCEEYFVAKVVDGKMEDVKTLLEDRQATLIEQWGTYLPEQVELIEAYQLVENEPYIVFAIGYNADTVIDAFEAKFE